MKWYADAGLRRCRQLGFDLLTIGWVATWVWLGALAHRQIGASASGARKVEGGGRQISTHLHEAAGILAKAPVVGGRVRRPVDQAADAGTQLQHAGQQLADNLGRVGAAIGVEIALVPVLVAIVGWAVVRVGYARRAGRSIALLRLPGGRDVVALDALGRLPSGALAAIGPDLAAGRRAGNPEVTDALVRNYLRSLGLRPDDDTSGTTSDGRKSPAGGSQVARSAGT
ncbi:hypothetical protein HJ588_16320 [Flexivirga sp. ID2601S]|uniref:Uncharacterized protein n=1 Tax=Flexivirga aerilata TaxID=1656889 RepID=A0A849AMV1_9MICO|nr:hypothetical protein [Flexivirga aerilata]NNG40826.1 hypothetical protein [Flexivirga aerilata]